jgi:hypothetical protein
MRICHRFRAAFAYANARIGLPPRRLIALRSVEQVEAPGTQFDGEHLFTKAILHPANTSWKNLLPVTHDL